MRFIAPNQLRAATRSDLLNRALNAPFAVSTFDGIIRLSGRKFSLLSSPSKKIFQNPSSILRSGAGMSSFLSTESRQRESVLDSDGFLNFDTLHEMQKNSSVAFADSELFGTFVPKDGHGPDRFVYMTYAEFDEQVQRARVVLKEIGLQEYSKVGIISNNRWEWVAVASAAYSLNATCVPMYEAQHPSDWSYILNDAGCDALFVSTQDIYNRCMKEVIPQTPSVKVTLCFNAPPGEAHAFSTHMDAASTNTVDSWPIAPTSEDLANLIYTSGTTGKPKGVELTHSNIVSNIKGVRGCVDDPHDLIRPSDRSLSFLPWAHSYGQSTELWMLMAHGCSVGICRGIPNILEDLQLVKPSVLFAVPTLYKRIYDGVSNLVENSSPFRKRLMKNALAIGRRRVEAENGGVPMGIAERIQFRALDSLVLSKIRQRFGGNLRHGFAGGAACPAEVIDFLDDIGIPVCEGYGLTETSPIICINTPHDRKAGSVGKAIKDVDVVIMGENGKPLPVGEEGEICCYGPNVMRGYYKNFEATEEVISLAPDGKSRLFHTGDLGSLDQDGRLKITGRLKEQYKLENGKYVCPTPIEEAMGMSRFITQVVLCGANRPYNVALIVPEWIAIRKELEIDDYVTEEDLANNERVNALIRDEVKAYCSNLKKFEVPQEWAFVAPFTAANNMLTPKMSIRRHMVIRAYEDVIGGMYNDHVGQAASTDGGNKELRAA